MIREIATRKSSAGYKGLLLIAAITIFVIFLSVLIGFIENYFGVKNLEYVIYVLLIGLSFFVIKYYVTQYRYSLFDDELIIERMLGKRIHIIVNVFIWDVVSFRPHVKSDESDKIITKTHKLYVQQANRYSIVYTKDDVTYEAVFSPSEEFVRQLVRAIEQRKNKQHRKPDIVT